MSAQLFNTVKASAFVIVFGLASAGSENSSAATINFGGASFSGLPGLRSPGLPAIGAAVNVTYKKYVSSGVLKTTYRMGGISQLKNVSAPYARAIRDTSYNLVAYFNAAGNFTTGNITIKGKIWSLGITAKSTLMTADLTAFKRSYTGLMYGFNTSNIDCHPIVDAAVGCTTDESVYIALKNPRKTLARNWMSTGTAYATIPQPQAVWLFGSGLIGMVGIARRSMNKAVRQ